jgi:hypothetical protein
LKLIIKVNDNQYFLVRDLNQFVLYDYLQHIAPKKWFELVKPDLSLGTLDLFELEQVLVRQQGELKKNTSTALQLYLSIPSDNKVLGGTRLKK